MDTAPVEWQETNDGEKREDPAKPLCNISPELEFLESLGVSIK